MLSNKTITGQEKSKKIILDDQCNTDQDDMQEGDIIVPQNTYQRPTRIDDEEGGNED